MRNNRNPEKTKYGHPPFRDAIIGGKTFDDFSRLLKIHATKSSEILHKTTRRAIVHIS